MKLALPFLLLALPLASQTPPVPLTPEEELEALLSSPLPAIPQKGLPLREAPGIVSLVSREEILASGARDLMEVLQLVPGFSFAADVQGAVGPVVRGNWAFEGKLLLLLDGQDLNETRFGTTAFGNHVPVDQIREIAIIRAPGSAIYGGSAELAVVNVITRTGADLGGVSGGVTAARGGTGWASRSGNAAYGRAEGDLEYSVAASAGSAQRSDQPWTAFGRTRELGQNSALDQTLVNAALKYKGFSLRAIHDGYQVRDFTFFLAGNPQPMRLRGDYLEAKYLWKPAPAFTVTTRAAYQTQQPWYYPGESIQHQRSTDRLGAGVVTLWEPVPAFNLTTGADWKLDRGLAQAPLWSNGRDRIGYRTAALFTQALFQGALGNLSLGARIDDNSPFGRSFVPRIAYTRVWSDFHIKLLASRAFRAPSIENFELNRLVRPERTTALELEAGAQLGHGASVSVNLFHISIQDPMVYAYDEHTGVETYVNHPRTGSQGLELDLQKRADWGFLRASLTLTQADDNRVPDYQVPGQKNFMVGIANLKATLLASWKLTDNFSFASSVIGLGRRYSFESDGGPHPLSACTVMNAMLHYKPWDSRFMATLGASNLTGAPVLYPKAYQGTDGDSYPGQGQAFFLRLAFNY